MINGNGCWWNSADTSCDNRRAVANFVSPESGKILGENNGTLIFGDTQILHQNNLSKPRVVYMLKTSSIHSSFSTKLQLVTDGWMDRHTATVLRPLLISNPILGKKLSWPVKPHCTTPTSSQGLSQECLRVIHLPQE